MVVSWYNENMKFLTSLRKFIHRHQLIPRQSRVVVGVSGGPDSLALLHALAQLAPAEGWQLHVAHLDHMLRPEAQAEAHFVAELAAAWGLGCTIEREDVQKLAMQPGVSLEEAARQARYNFLGRVAQRLAAPVIAVGHHADDQVETMLMHLLRGSGLAGLRGMPPQTELNQLRLSAGQTAPPAASPDFAGIQLIRPLLSFTRDEILEYCRQNSLQPRWDLSNLDTTIFRNHLRHQIIPQLKDINPNLTKVLTHTAFALQGDYESLQAQRDELWQKMAVVEADRVRLPLADFRSLPRGHQRALLRRAIATLRPQQRNINWEHTERVLDVLTDHPQQASGGPYTLVAGLEAWLSYQWLDVQAIDFIPRDAPQISSPQILSLPGSINLGPAWRLQARLVQWKAENAPWQQQSDPNTIWLPPDIPQPLQLRPRQEGEKMHPLGISGEKSLKDLMNESKIPRCQRARWPLLVDAQGRILWLLGHRFAAEGKVDALAGQAWEITLVQER